MGAAESVVRNVDKRTARRENKTHFIGAIEEFRQVLEIQQTETLLDRQSSLQSVNSDDNRFIRVCIRKRPIFEHEIKAGEFDVITCQGQQQSGDGVGRVIVHDARMHADMRRMMMDHHTFEYDEVFGEEVDNEGVYRNTTSRLVDLVLHGGDATVMMYGQTGSGKTYTMSSIYEQTANELFQKLSETKEKVTVKLSFLELSGDSCSDVLNESKPVKLVTTADGAVEAYPSVEVPVANASEMMSFIRHATTMRVKAATGVHDQSSRSHAICRVYLHRATQGGHPVHPGVNSMLTLVDLAGSEHRIDSAEHNANRRKEGAQINSSLMKLKECVRARANRASYIPYRQSKLTHLLRASFVEPAAGTLPSQTVIIATVSPSSKDTEHSLNTLRHACIMDGQGEADEKRWVSGGERIRVFVGEIDVAGIARARKRDKQVGESAATKPGSSSRRRRQAGDGAGAKWQALSKNHARDGSIDPVSKALNEKKAAAMREKRRRSEERRSLAEMTSSEVEVLMKAREQAGASQRQRIGEKDRRGSLTAQQAVAMIGRRDDPPPDAPAAEGRAIERKPSRVPSRQTPRRSGTAASREPSPRTNGSLRPNGEQEPGRTPRLPRVPCAVKPKEPTRPFSPAAGSAGRARQWRTQEEHAAYGSNEQDPQLPKHVMTQRLQIVKKSSALDQSRERRRGRGSPHSGSIRLPDPTPKRPTMEELKDKVWRDPMVPRSMREREFIAVLRDHGYLDNDEDDDDAGESVETPETNKSARSVRSTKSFRSNYSMKSNNSTHLSARNGGEYAGDERPIKSKYRPTSREAVVDAETEMERLQEELHVAEEQKASKATLFGIRKRLAIQKAVLIRDERRKLAIQQQMEEDGGRHLIL